MSDSEPLLAALHEMRSATLAINAIMSLIRGREPALAEPLAGELDMVARSARRIDRLVTMLHPLLGRARGAAEIDLLELLADAVAASGAEADDRGVAVALEPVGPVVIRAEPELAAAAVRGLVSAAIRAAPVGGALAATARRGADRASIELGGLAGAPSGVDRGLLDAMAARLGGELAWSEGATLNLELPLAERKR